MTEKQLKNGKNRAKKAWLSKENIIFLWLGRMSTVGVRPIESGRVGISDEVFVTGKMQSLSFKFT